MVFIARQEPFICEKCKFQVEPLKKGSYRNHCPKCLYSKHVDRDGPGDRLSSCQGLLQPTSLDYRSNKGYIIIHTCQKCGKISPNKAAEDDNLTLLQPTTKE